MGLNIQKAKEKIIDVYYTYYRTTTVCFISVECGSIFVGESHCFDINDYSINEGQKQAYTNAFKKFMDAEAHLQKTIQHMARQLGGDKKLPDPISGGVLE